MASSPDLDCVATADLVAAIQQRHDIYCIFLGQFPFADRDTCRTSTIFNVGEQDVPIVAQVIGQEMSDWWAEHKR